MQLVFWVQDAGGVGIDYLEIFAADHSHDTVAGSLCFMSYDGKLLANQFVHQGGFPRVRFPNYVNISGFMHNFIVLAA
jgi:hypothetical protein